MITSPLLYFNGRAMKWLGLQALFILISCAAYAQINTNDPTLKLWLKGDTLSGSTVPVWADSSTNGTVLTVPPLPTVDTANDPENHTPQLIVANNNGLTFNAVHFRQANDPSIPPPNGHLADRLWQTNNLDANDPTLIDPTHDITIIVVFQNNAVHGVGGAPCIVAKRGAACPYELGEWEAVPSYMFVTYVSPVVFNLGNPIPTAPEWSIIEMNVTAGGTLSFREYFRSMGGWANYSMTGVGRGGGLVGEPFTICCHTQGATPPDNVLGLGGASERFAGDLAEVVMYNRTLSGSELAATEAYLLTKYFLNAGPPVITTQPQGTSVPVFSPVTFSVLADGTPPFSYQWLKGTPGTPIVGAPDSPTYTIASATGGDSGVYSVKVSNSVGFTNSLGAVLTVIVPTNKPTVLSALRDYADSTKLTVVFSGLVSASTATTIANYSINNGVTVNGATAAEGTTFVTSVVLSTTPITTAPSTLTVNGVQDRYGNVATDAKATIPIPGIVGTPPSANRLLWLAADTNVLSDSIGVYQWDDQSDPSMTHSAFPSFGNVKVGQVACPNAMHSVLSFDGTCGLLVAGTAAFNLQNITIYLVGDLDAAKQSDDFIGNWEGYVLGGSDSRAGALKWATWGGGAGGVGNSYYPIDPSPVLGNRVPTLIVAAFANPGDQTLALNTVQVGILPNTKAIDYTTARGFMIGALFPGGTQNLVGDISEILVYTSVSPAQDTAVQNYLISKYFTPAASGPGLVSATVSINQNTEVTVVFSSAVTPGTAANASKYAINHGVTVSAATVVNATTVRLTTSPINWGPTYTLTATGVTDWAGNAATTPVTIAVPSDVARLQDSSANNLLVLEAENYTLNTPGAGQSWTFTTSSPFLLPTSVNTNFSGTGCMVALPNSGTSYSYNPGDMPVGIPELDYRVYFATSGTFTVWVRGSGDSDAGGASDSINLGLDGVVAFRENGQWPQAAGYAWGSTPTPTGATFTVPTSGAHIINVWMREDGFVFDKLVLSGNPAYTPAGIGPTESAAILLPITATYSGGSLTLTWSGSGILQSATNAAGAYADVVGASSPWTITPTGVQKYYRIRE